MTNKINKYLKKIDLINLQNKTVIITGGNSGIGLMSAKYFAYLGAKVIIAVRNISKGDQAIQEIKNEIANCNVSLMELDISKENSIRKFVSNIIKNNIDIDIFYHNAGVYRLPFEIVEGKDIITSTNYFGPLLLTSLLLPYLHKLNHEVTMVITSSIAAKLSNYKKLSLEPNPKDLRTSRYNHSKLLDAFMFKYLNEHDNKNIKYFLVHPGLTNTGLFKKAYKNKVFIFLINVYMSIFANPLWKSSLSILCCFTKNAKKGTFYGPTKLLHFVGQPKVCHFLDNKYNNVEKIINDSEKIIGNKLLD